MSQPYVGEIRMFAGNFAPNGWLFCAGQTLPISENEVLFQLIGTTYGGDGESTFQLPDLQGRAPVHFGNGTGIANVQIGEKAGVESVTLTTQQLPSHAHALAASGSGADGDAAAGAVPGVALANAFTADGTGLQAMAAGTLQAAGGSQPHDNMPPYLAMNFIISLFGVFPSPS